MYSFFKRLFDIVVSLVAIAVTSPLWLIAFIGIKAQSPGPVFYRAKRVGRGGDVFIMHKFRSMHWRPQNEGAAITGANDSRVFRFGAFLRKSKIDELPQFLDVLRGDLSVVGPRPEDATIVAEHYTDWMKDTLSVKPGITSPGALWGYTKMEEWLTGADPEKDYVEKVLPYKLALEYVYIKKRSFAYDCKLIWRTAIVVAKIVAGKKKFAEQPEDKDIEAVMGRAIRPG